MHLEDRLRAARDRGRKLLVPYVTGGLPGWTEAVAAAVAGGADAVEVGIPFSDPIMDGPTIQDASARALAAGATPEGVVAELGALDVDAPLAVMTYYNPVGHAGHRRFAALLADAGVDAAIIPDLPLDELEPWAEAAAAAGVETVLFAAPTTTEERLAAICARAQGFVYAVALLGVTGERTRVEAKSGDLATRCRRLTDTPVLLGLGISGAEQAREAASAADGVIVGSAVVRRLLEGDGPEGVGAFVAELRAGLDRT